MFWGVDVPLGLLGLGTMGTTISHKNIVKGGKCHEKKSVG